MCIKHYYRMRNHGSIELPLARNAKLDTPEKIKARLQQRSNRVGDCLLWQGSTVKGGYGVFRPGGKSTLVHRSSYEVHIGPIPEGKQVHHTCFRTNCIEPAHLELVTHQENCQARSGPQKRSLTGVRGVSWNARNQRWEARVRVGGKLHFVGSFTDLQAADKAVTAKRKELGFYGE